MGRVWATMVVYHLVFVVAFVLYLPVLLWRMVRDPRYRHGIRERMGYVPASAGSGPVVWLHGVSVGEVKAAGNLIRALRERHPEIELVLSSTTPTGLDLARRLHPDLRVFFYPLDFAAFPSRALDRVRPACVLLVELEVWPNFLQAAARRSIPVMVINGRMSAKSFRGYRWARGLLPQFDLIQVYCVQDSSYATRIRALGVPPSRVLVTGNMKYDSLHLKEAPPESARLRRWLSPDGRAVLVCGSTHGEEEVWLAGVAQRVSARLRRPLRLVLAPRHPERVPGVRERLRVLGAPTVSWKERMTDLRPLGDAEVVVVDTIGHLEAFYGAGDLAFVGGSLVPHGGQNMLEPAALGKPVLFGRHTQNFRRDVDLLLGAKAAIQVRDLRQLEDEIARLWSEPERGRALGAAAVALIRSNQGATERTMSLLEPVLARALGTADAVAVVRPGAPGAGSGPRP